MATSFSINRSWVFVEANGGSWPVVEFVVVTLIAAYGLQSFVIWLLSLDSRGSHSNFNVGGLVYASWIGLPGREVKRLAFGLAGCGGVASAGRVDFVERNLVKGAALGVALIWNFSWYRWYVFV
jgi:putative flippase GtrA